MKNFQIINQRSLYPLNAYDIQKIKLSNTTQT